LRYLALVCYDDFVKCSIFNFGYFFLLLCFTRKLTLEPTVQITNNITLLKEASDFSCSILLGKNYLSYVITDAELTQIHLLNHYYLHGKVLGKNDFNSMLTDPVFKNVKNIKIAIDSTRSTLVPTSLFDPKEANTYFEFVHELVREEELHIQHLKNNLTAVFSLKKSTIAFLRSIYKNATFCDASSCLLDAYQTALTNEEQVCIFVCVKDDCATLSLYNKNNLILHQIYTETNVSDITYHIANILSVKEIGKETITIQLHGESKQVPAVFDELSRYFQNVKYCNRISALNYPDSMLSQPTHYFFNLLSVVTCA